MLSRRSFFKGLAAVAAVAVLPAKLLARPRRKKWVITDRIETKPTKAEGWSCTTFTIRLVDGDDPRPEYKVVSDDPTIAEYLNEAHKHLGKSTTGGALP